MNPPAIKYISLIGLISVLITGCIAEEFIAKPEKSKAIVSLLLRASSSTINKDYVQWEDRVDEIRMIAFDLNGQAVFNDKLNFPNGFNNRCEAVAFTPGSYTLYFIANESACTGDFVTAISSVANLSQLQTDARFRQIQYNPDFMPDGSTGAGRFLMSARYDAIEVVEGGTKQNPNPVVLPAGRVELIRSLAKIEIVFRKKVSGGSVPNNSITSIQLEKVAKEYSVPAIDAYYTGQTDVSQEIVPSGFDYTNDSIGSVVFYVPEFLNQTGSADFTELHINDKSFPIASDDQKIGLTYQRRTIPSLSNYSVIRNYHYIIDAYINSAGGIQLKICVNPWNKDSYKYMFQDPNHEIVTPPVVPTDTSVIVPTDCGKIEILSHNESLQQGLQGAYGDQINWWDPAVQGPSITKGQPPYYCEEKYGPGWRLINSCELMSFLGLFDQTYRIWQSNTWEGVNSGLPFYTLPFRQEAQNLLEKLTGTDLSGYVLTDNGKDNFGSEKLNMLDDFFTPGDIMITENDYPGGWPFETPPNDGNNKWFPMEVVLQVKGYWYTGYYPYSDPANYNTILYQRFEQYNFSSTVSRCVREVE
jgi:hypothetical protein